LNAAALEPAGQDAQSVAATTAPPAGRRRFHGPSAATLQADAERRRKIEQLKARQREEAARLAAESSTQATDETGAPIPADSSTVATAEGTLRYWNAVNAVIDRELADRGGITRGELDEKGAVDFFQRRRRSAVAAESALRRLPTTDVDAEAVALGGRLADWYGDNARVARDGLDLVSSAPEKRRGAPGRAWQSDEKKLRETMDSLNGDAETLRRRLSARYGIEFSPMK
jgi:hypothetical protein